VLTKILVGNFDRKRTLGRPERRQEGKYEMILKKEDGRIWTGLNWQ
jgi:hypothetical protein